MRLGLAISFVRGVFRDFFEDDVLSLAAAIAFYTALSFAPLVLLLVSVGGWLGDGAKNELLGLFAKQLGPRAADVAQGIVEASSAGAASSAQQWWRGALSSVGLLITASAVFGQLQTSLNKMWDVAAPVVQASRRSGRWRGALTSVWGWLRKRLISMGMVLVVLFILLVSLVLSAVVGVVVPKGGLEEFSARAAEFVVSLLVATLLFAAIFRVLPDVHIAWREVWLGAVVTAVLFSVGKLVLALYINKGGVGKDYGEAVGGLIGLLVWVFYSSVALLLGAEITQRLSRGRRGRTEAMAAPFGGSASSAISQDLHRQAE